MRKQLPNTKRFNCWNVPVKTLKKWSRFISDMRSTYHRIKILSGLELAKAMEDYMEKQYKNIRSKKR